MPDSSQHAPEHSRPEDRKLVHLFQGVNKFFCRVYHQLRVLSPCQLPKTGPAILVCNHISGLDPLLIQSASSRLITWMMAKEYYDLPLLKHVFETIEAIPVERSGKDLSATRAAMRALSDGRVLGIFPEGKIGPDKNLLPFQTGVALLAARSQAPIFPARLEGTQRGREMVPAFTVACTSTLAFGPKVICTTNRPGREALDDLTRAIQRSVQALSVR